MGRKHTRWWKLKDEEVGKNVRRKIVERQSDSDEVTNENMEEWWEETTEQIRKCGEEVCGMSTEKKKPRVENWWWNVDTDNAVKEKKDRPKIWKRTGADIDRAEYKRAKATAKKVVARGSEEAVETT